MILLNEETAIQIEKAALESLEQYGDRWRALTHQQILDQKATNLELLENFNGLEIRQILESDVAEDFMRFCVQLSICQMILTDGKIPPDEPLKLL